MEPYQILPSLNIQFHNVYARCGVTLHVNNMVQFTTIRYVYKTTSVIFLPLIACCIGGSYRECCIRTGTNTFIVRVIDNGWRYRPRVVRC